MDLLPLQERNLRSEGEQPCLSASGQAMLGQGSPGYFAATALFDSDIFANMLL